jgi:hypothetical protein
VNTPTSPRITPYVILLAAAGVLLALGAAYVVSAGTLHPALLIALGVLLVTGAGVLLSSDSSAANRTTQEARAAATSWSSTRHQEGPGLLAEASRSARGLWSSFEEGVPADNDAEGFSVGSGPKPATTAQVLCGVCGDYFEMVAPSDRPLTLLCAACETWIRLRGDIQFAPLADLSCRACHESNRVPKTSVLASFHCISCGHLNPLRAIGSVPAVAAPAERTLATVKDS